VERKAHIKQDRFEMGTGHGKAHPEASRRMVETFSDVERQRSSMNVAEVETETFPSHFKLLLARARAHRVWVLCMMQWDAKSRLCRFSTRDRHVPCLDD